MCNGPAYHRGNCERVTTAFAPCCPGRLEEENNRPLAGASGENVRYALPFLRERIGACVFPSENLDDYSIINVWPYLEYPDRTQRTEPTCAEVTQGGNLDILRRVIGNFGIRTVICLGDKSILACRHLNDVVRYCGPHPSNQRLNTTFRSNCNTPLERRQHRTQQWAESIILDEGDGHGRA